MNISVNLKRLRRERDLTQEKLAAIIGVVPQAVSKWERGEGLPDITLVPSIAAALDVSTDELFGMDEERRQLRVKEIHEEWGRIIGREDDRLEWDKGNAFLREQLRELPDEWSLWQTLAASLFQGSGIGTDKYDEAKVNEAIDILERIADRCPDLRIRNSAVPFIAIIYSSIGEYEKAKEYAKLLPRKNSSYEHTAPQFLRGQELREFLETDIADTSWYLSSLMKSAASNGQFTGGDGKNCGYTPEERIEWLELGIKLLELMKNKPWGGIWAQTCCSYLVDAALIMLETGEHERALDYIERAETFCTPYEGEIKARITLSPTTVYSGETDVVPTENARKLFLGLLEDVCSQKDGELFPLSREPRFVALKKRLEKLAQ